MTRPDYWLTKLSKLRIDRPRVGGAEGLPRRAVQVAASSQKTFRLSPGFAAEQRKKPISVLCTDTRVEIPAIAEMIEGTLRRMRKCSQQHGLNIEANLLKPMYEESFWVNIIGRGYPPPNRTFRWCTQRMKIDPVNDFVKQRIGHRGEPILHLGACRAENSTRAQTMAGRQARNGLNRFLTCPPSGSRIRSSSSARKRFGPICFRTRTRGVATTVRVRTRHGVSLRQRLERRVPHTEGALLRVVLE